MISDIRVVLRMRAILNKKRMNKLGKIHEHISVVLVESRIERCLGLSGAKLNNVRRVKSNT